MPRFTKSLLYNKQAAFTFIELLMTTAIMVLLLSVGIVNYLRFLDKQKLYQAGSSLESMLEDARTKAQNGYLGDTTIGFCNQLTSVEVFSGLDAKQQPEFVAQLRCANSTTLPYDKYSVVEAGTVLSPNFKVNFLPLRGTIVWLNDNLVASGAATLSRADAQVIFNLDQGGTIDVRYQ